MGFGTDDSSGEESDFNDIGKNNEGNGYCWLTELISPNLSRLWLWMICVLEGFSFCILTILLLHIYIYICPGNTSPGGRSGIEDKDKERVVVHKTEDGLSPVSFEKVILIV